MKDTLNDAQACNHYFSCWDGCCFLLCACFPEHVILSMATTVLTLLLTNFQKRIMGFLCLASILPIVLHTQPIASELCGFLGGLSQRHKELIS